MEAEQNRDNLEEFRRLIELSIDFLEKAISLFTSITESNLDRTGEQGDCLSLLGRTHYVAGNHALADKAATQAANLLTDDTSKDYADLQILLGDVAARRSAEEASGYYDTAIRVAGIADAERSEIAARAYYQKGRVLNLATSLDKAAEIYDRLEEDLHAANARWHSLLLSGRVPKEGREHLNTAKPEVRVEAMRLYEAAMTDLPSGSRGRRSRVPSSYWKDLVETAEKNVAIRKNDW